jgi:tetratricopeptide (TPR) repeat protein
MPINTILLAQFYLAVGDYYATKHNMSRALHALESAIELSVSSGHLAQQSSTLLSMARIQSVLGRHHASRAHALEAQRCSRASGNLYMEARSLFREATSCTFMGDYKNSSFLLRRGRELLRLCGMSGGNLDHNMMDREADIHLLKSEYPEARSIHTQIVEGTAAEQDTYMLAVGLLNIAEIDVIIGADASGISLNVEKARAVLSAVSFLRGLIYADMILADLCLRDGHISTAWSKFIHLLHSAWGNNSEMVAYGLERLANGSRWTDTPLDWRWPMVYLAHSKTTHERLPLNKSLCFLGDVFLAIGDEETAQTLFIVALDGFNYMDVHQGRADCMLRLGDIAKRRGDSVKATTFWNDARPLFERSMQAKDAARVDARLASLDQFGPAVI